MSAVQHARDVDLLREEGKPDQMVDRAPNAVRGVLARTMEDHGVHHDERPRGRLHHPLVLADERLGREPLAHVAAG